MKDFIKPTIGRKVYYIPQTQEGSLDCNSLDSGMTRLQNADGATPPFDANIVYVWSDTCVNLLVTDHNGYVFRRCSVPINVDQSASPLPLPRAEWMDYQKGQAAKSEQLEAELQSKLSAGEVKKTRDVLSNYTYDDGKRQE